MTKSEPTQTNLEELSVRVRASKRSALGKALRSIKQHPTKTTQQLIIELIELHYVPVSCSSELSQVQWKQIMLEAACNLESRAKFFRELAGLPSPIPAYGATTIGSSASAFQLEEGAVSEQDSEANKVPHPPGKSLTELASENELDIFN